ncbi:putative ankyrin repeat protein RF_0381 [Triticum dicoccoides]|uniref:putative ankyrin repeat protein RF_0381 n=1 Tax=Triticum dicoccoides TaxID=85692 RepID=UPI001891CBA8|nr:putative ankyrin repeat protein RF_0381 [Triticum dicoccoides]
MEPKMDAGLLALACSGSFHDLESFLNGKPAAYTIGSSATRPPSLYAVTVEGDTLLHVVVASHGESEDLLNKANLVYGKAPSLLFVQNNGGDTPLHFAARGGNLPMVSLLIDLANSQGINNGKGLLETQNKLKETALHEAVRIENNDMVNLLMTHAPELATIPAEGTSPLYLAILMENKIVAKTLYELSSGVLPYSGPNGQNALHVAVQRSQADRKKTAIVDYACRNISLSWILNIQDKDGNTALHIAIRKRSMRMFCSLLGNRQVHLNLMNEKGETPSDIAHQNLRKEMGSIKGENEPEILNVLKYIGAKRGISHQGFLNEYDTDQARQDEIHFLSQMKEGTQSRCACSVLIATVTFGAMFTMPGGYRDEDHTHAGSPILAGTFAFGTFFMANTFAFAFSITATIFLMFSGDPTLLLCLQ